MNGFKEFIMKGNVVELAVAVVMGTAFGAIVTAIVDGIITPLIAEAFNADDIENATVGIFKIGLVIAAIIKFLAIAAVVYFALVLPMSKLIAANNKRKGITEAEAEETEIDVLHQIRDLLGAQGQAPAAPRA